MSYPVDYEIPITVVAGVGNTPKIFHGEIVKAYINAPDGARYTHRVDNPRGTPAHMAQNLIDDVLDENPYPVNGNMNFRIFDADADGQYILTVWFRAR